MINGTKQSANRGNGDNFRSYDLHPVHIIPFTEPLVLDHTLLPDFDLLKYMCLVSMKISLKPWIGRLTDMQSRK